MDRRRGCFSSILACTVTLVVVLSILVPASSTRQKSEDGTELSGKPMESKVSSSDQSNDSMVKDGEKGASKGSGESSRALNKFLDDVLKARNDLKWIDEVARTVDRQKDSDKKDRRGRSKPREKRRSYDRIYGYEDIPGYPRPENPDNDAANKAGGDSDDADASAYGASRQDFLLRDKGTGNDGVSSGWPKPRDDLCSLSEWLKNAPDRSVESEAERSDRWRQRDYESDRRNGGIDSLDFREGASAATSGARLNVRNQRDGTKKGEEEEEAEKTPSLQSLKETILQLKKRLNDGEKKPRENSRNAEARDKEADKRSEPGRRARSRNKHRNTERKEEGKNLISPREVITSQSTSAASSDQWEEDSEPDSFDLKKREQSAAAAEADPANEVWRTKRTEVNTEDGGPRLFHRAGFGEPYPDAGDVAAKESRERRSEGSPADEGRKRRSENEAAARSRPASDTMKISKAATDCKDTIAAAADNKEKKEFASNDSRVPRVLGRQCDLTNSREDSNASGPAGSHEAEGGRDHQRASPVSSQNVNTLEIESPSESTGSQVRAASSILQTPASSSGSDLEVASDAGRDKNDRTNEASADPEAYLRGSGERTKRIRGTESEQEAGKSASAGSGDRDPGDVNILMRTENRNLIQFSKGSPAKEGGSPFLVNAFDASRRTVLENGARAAGKSVSSVYDVKIERAQLDDAADRRNRYRERDRVGEDAADRANDVRRRNANEKEPKSSVDDDEESRARNRDWFEDAVSDRMIAGADRGSTGMASSQPERKDTTNRNGMESSGDDEEKARSAGDANYRTQGDGKGRGKKKYTEIFIVPDGTDDRVISDRYGQRRILQYMEYSNDDVEDADASYSDNEEEQSQGLGQASAAENHVAAFRRNERTPSSDVKKKKARVDIMIQDKIDKRKQRNRKQKTSNRGRRRRNPEERVIEYYDYDSDAEQRQQAESEQERSKSNYDDGNGTGNGDAVESNAGLENEACMPPAAKKDEHEESMLKEERAREKLKNKAPKQEFVSADRSGGMNATGGNAKPDESAARMSTSKAKFFMDEEEEEEGSLLGEQRAALGSRSERPSGENEDKFLERGNSDGKGTMASSPTKCLVNVYRDLDPAGIDDILEDVEPLDDKNERAPSNAEPLYEELKMIYDWSEDETKRKPRIKGDQRMYHAADDKSEATDGAGESLREIGPPESPEIPGPSDASVSSPDLLPLLLVDAGSGGPGSGGSGSSTGTGTAIAEKMYRAVAGRAGREISTGSNVSRSNYFALKSTDDMFKGGPEQNNNTGEKLRGPSVIGQPGEWRGQTVNGATTASASAASAEKEAAGWSLTVPNGRYIDTDSRSPYEARKYPESRYPADGLQPHAAPDPEKQSVISSKDLHESFVEPLDWIDDDYDRDARGARPGRSLRTVRAAVSSNGTGQDNRETIKGAASTYAYTYAPREGSLVAQPSGLQKLFRPGEKRGRVRRELPPFSEDTHYGDARRPRRRGGDGMDDASGYTDDELKMNRNPRFAAAADPRNTVSSTDEDSRSEDEDDDDDDDYGKAARSGDSKTVKRHGSKGKTKQRRDGKAKKRKGDGGAKARKKSRGGRRRHKKHSTPAKTRKKHASHRGSAKKSKVREHRRESPSRKGHDARANAQRGEEEEDTILYPASGAPRNRISSLLTADNMEDESQMDSALHGELAGKIVQRIFGQVQKNENLKVSLGTGLYRKHEARDTLAAENSYRRAIDNDEIKHTEELLRRIVLLLNRLIFDEVQRKTCVSLTPDLTEFLDWMLDVNPRRDTFEQPPTLPLVRDEVSRGGDFPRDKFLFQTYPNKDVDGEINELYRKIRLIKGLIKEYSQLTEKDKQKIRSIERFLAKQLDLLLEYIEAKEEAERKVNASATIGAARGRVGSIVQYEIGTSAASNGSYATSLDAFRPRTTVPSMFEPGDVDFLASEEIFRDGDAAVRRAARGIARSLEERGAPRKKRKGRRGRKRRKRARKDAGAIDQSRGKGPEYKARRRKREYSAHARFWDSADSGYEEPLIYASMDIPDLAIPNGKNDAAFTKRTNAEDAAAADLRPRSEKTPSEVESSRQQAKGVTESDEEALKELARTQARTRENSVAKKEDEYRSKETETAEPITGRNRLEDEILLLNKRQAWRQKNEQQLEEVAFGEDMRKAVKEKELFEELTEIDKRRNDATEKNEQTKR